MRRVLLIVLFTISLFCTSCHQDETGKWRLDPFAADKIEGAADTTAGVFSLLSLFIPGAAGVAGIAAGVATTFKKMKPGLTKYKKTSTHIVTAVERIKENQPEFWAQIKAEFKTGTDADIEAVIDQIVTIQKAQEKNT
jgi:thioredoxin-related protein